MARKRVESSERERAWRRLVDEWRESGLTQTAFCRGRGVAVASFRWWKWKLGLPGRPPAEGRVQDRPAGALPAFVPVRIVEPEVRRGGSPGDGFELELPGGRVLRVPVDFEAESLARLLAVIEEHGSC